MTILFSQKFPVDQKVHVAKGDDPYENTRAVLNRIDLSFLKNKRVLLKPNVGRIAPLGQGIITDSRVVAAAIDWFTEIGANVAIGESPIVGVDTMEAFHAAGITEVADKRKCRLIDLNEGKYVELPAPDGIAVKGFKACNPIFKFDFLVSIPVMKMHMHTGVSLSIKNMKGCLWRRSKVDLHMLPPVSGNEEKPINIAIADMSGVLRPHLSIIDGTVGMEGLGPSAGKARAVNVVLAGLDPFAVDAVACRLMGTTAEKIPHLSMGAERGFGVIDLNQIQVSPENWEDWITPFLPPPENLSIEFPNVKVHDKNSCSACQSTLLLFLKRYRTVILDYFPKDELIQFAIGKGHETIPENTICIGNCSANIGKSRTFIKGCPPVASEILCEITGKLSIDLLDGKSETPD
ncbi:MAG: hypothetical protein C0403_11060 [Desulfobacterium sp.]|nr:hypothetical protein [Desulfobacterium sp.]